MLLFLRAHHLNETMGPFVPQSTIQEHSDNVPQPQLKLHAVVCVGGKIVAARGVRTNDEHK